MKNDKEKKNKTNINDEKKILPIRHYDEGAGAYVLSDGSYLNIFEIAPKDKENLLEDEVQFDMLRFARLYKLYRADLKIVALNFPVNTSGQRNFLEEKMKKINSPIKLKWLKRSINELALQDANKTKREYYLIYFAENDQELAKNTRRIISVLDTGKGGAIREVSPQKKHQIMHKLNNMSSLIIIDEGEKADEE